MAPEILSETSNLVSFTVKLCIH